jgi:rubrerythrin
MVEVVRDKEVGGGKTCEKAYFICKECVYNGVIFISGRTTCPICKNPLR